MMYKIILGLLLIVIPLFISCNDNGVGPKPEDKPGRRYYVWTVDTINVQYPVGKIWGSSPADVWAVNESDLSTGIWHYDGNKWSTDGLFRLILPHSIWGSSQNNVFIGGSGGRIWKYNGSSWNEFAILKKDGRDDIIFNDIWGESPGSFFAYGAYPDENGYYNNSVVAYFNSN